MQLQTVKLIQLYIIDVDAPEKLLFYYDTLCLLQVVETC